MIPLRYFVKMFQKDEEDLLRWLRLNKITSSKIGNTWLVDEVSFYRVVRLNLKLSHYDEYLAEEIKSREIEITNILLQLDDLMYLFKSAFKISPALRLLINEMALLITDEQKRNVFTDVMSGIHITKVAEKYGVTFQQACYLNDAAMKCIGNRLGFINEYRCNRAKEKLTIRRLEIINQNQWSEIVALKDELNRIKDEGASSKGYTEEKIPDLVVKLLSLRLKYDLDLNTRCVNCLRTYELETVEDLLRFIKDNSIERLMTARNLGQKSIMELKGKLEQAGIIDKTGHSYLMKYLR